MLLRLAVSPLHASMDIMAAPDSVPILTGREKQAVFSEDD